MTELFTFQFRNGVKKEEQTFKHCSLAGHHECMRVKKTYPCGCIETFTQHFIGICSKCGGLSEGYKTVTMCKGKTYCKKHKPPRTEAHKEHISDSLKRYYANKD